MFVYTIIVPVTVLTLLLMCLVLSIVRERHKKDIKLGEIRMTSESKLDILKHWCATK